jgi:RNA polymerase sigma factor (sigma-70 family)
MSDSADIFCERAKKGDVAAASELVTLFYQRIFAYLRRLSGNDEDAADLTQKTFERTWQSLGSYQKRSTFSTWLHGIAHHVYLDWRRKRSTGDAQSDTFQHSVSLNSWKDFRDYLDADSWQNFASYVSIVIVARREVNATTFQLGVQLNQGNNSQPAQKLIITLVLQGGEWRVDTVN